MKISLFLALTAFIPSLALADGTGDAHKVKTRFGVADSTTHELTLNGKPVHPRAIGNGFLLVDKVAKTGDADYLLLTSDGGAACPASFSVVKVTASGATPTAFFGNCEDRHKVEVVEGKSIIVSFPEFRNQYVHVAGTTIVYDMPTGKLTENGRPTASSCQKGICEGL